MIRRFEYRCWPDAIELSNDEVRLVVVPAIGRIMHYGFRKETNILWENPEWFGKILPKDGFFQEKGKPVWANFGGDKIWPMDQKDFGKVNGRDWPPDHWLDGGTHEAGLQDDCVIITSPVSRYCGARSIREIRLNPGGTRVSIKQTLEKVHAAADPRLEPIAHTIWNITQIRMPEQTLFNLNPKSKLPGGYKIYEEAPWGSENFFVDKKAGCFLPLATKWQKAGADSDFWLAAIVSQTAIAELFRLDESGQYPDGGISASVFTCPEYAELELMSPTACLLPGQKLHFEIAWEMKSLPPEAGNAEKRRLAALDWLAGRA
ncbi:hypothetical protein JW906_03270 [bacterium]|nr:hypothetical protein [bacterium]